MILTLLQYKASQKRNIFLRPRPYYNTKPSKHGTEYRVMTLTILLIKQNRFVKNKI